MANIGKVKQIIGAVVDVHFGDGNKLLKFFMLGNQQAKWR